VFGRLAGRRIGPLGRLDRPFRDPDRDRGPLLVLVFRGGHRRGRLLPGGCGRRGGSPLLPGSAAGPPAALCRHGLVRRALRLRGAATQPRLAARLSAAAAVSAALSLGFLFGERLSSRARVFRVGGLSPARRTRAGRPPARLPRTGDAGGGGDSLHADHSRLQSGRADRRHRLRRASVRGVVPGTAGEAVRGYWGSTKGTLRCSADARITTVPSRPERIRWHPPPTIPA